MVDEAYKRVFKIHRIIGDKSITLEITNNDFSPTAQTNDSGVNPLTLMVAGYEGLWLSPYFCEAGKETIGFGHRPPKGEHAKPKITIQEAFTYLRDDLTENAAALKKRFKIWNELIPGVQGPLTSLNFNTSGIGKHLAEAIDKGDGEAIRYWVGQYGTFLNPKHNFQREELPGLVNRRNTEQDVIYANYGDVWQKTLGEDDSLLDKLFAKGATTDEVGHLFDGIANVEIVQKGQLVFKSGEQLAANAVIEIPRPKPVATTPPVEIVESKPKEIAEVSKPKPVVSTSPAIVKHTETKPKNVFTKEDLAAQDKFRMAYSGESNMHNAMHKAHEALHKPEKPKENLKLHQVDQAYKPALQPFHDASVNLKDIKPIPGNMLPLKNNSSERQV